MSIYLAPGLFYWSALSLLSGVSLVIHFSDTKWHLQLVSFRTFADFGYFLVVKDLTLGVVARK